MPLYESLNLRWLRDFQNRRPFPRLALLLTDLLTVERIKIPLQGRTKDELLQELVGLVVPAADMDGAEVLRAVREREAVLSTGIGKGVAIPHGKSGAVPELCMAAGRTAEPVDFDALDGEPVRLVFLLVGPESEAGPHIKALSRISRIVRREPVRERLISADSAADFYRALEEAEVG